MAERSPASVVGRDAHVDQVASLLAPSSGGSVLFVTGTAGMGKTSLITAGLDRAPTGIAVGWGTCWDGEGAPAFWPFVRAFDRLADDIGADEAERAAGADRDLLAPLIRALGPAAATHGDPDRHRLLLLDAARRWLEALSAHRPVALVIDDLQWADPSSLDLLQYLTATPVRGDLVVIGAYRHDELDTDQRRRLSAAASHAGHIHLEGLTVADVEELVTDIRGPEEAARTAASLHERTGGHPFFVRELALLPEGAGAVPGGIVGVVARRIDGFDTDTKEVLDAASVLGNRLRTDVLAATTDRTAAEVAEALDPTIAAGIVELDESGDRWFAHDLFREAIADELSATRRVDLHARIADALEARHLSGHEVAPGDIAWHMGQAPAMAGTERLVEWARRAAADERRRSAFAEAAAHLRRTRAALAAAGTDIEPNLLVDVLLDEADAQARSGDPDGARELLQAADRVAPDAARRADVALAVHRLGAKFAAPRQVVVSQLEAALTAVGRTDTIRQARLTAALARELQHSIDRDRVRAEPLSAEALALGRESGDDDTLASCLLARHDARWVPGTGAERAQLGREIAAVGNRLGDTDRAAEGLLLEANGLLEAGAAGFRPVLDAWFGLLDARAEPRDRYMVLTRRAAIALLDGRADDAHHLMTQAASLGERIREPDTGNVLMSQRVALARVLDDADEYRRLAHDAVAHWTGAPVLAHAVAAGACAKSGDLDDAAHEVAAVTAAGGLAREGSYLRSVLVGHLAEAAVALGDEPLCQDLMAVVEPLTDDCGVNGAVVAFAGPFAYPAAILADAIGEPDRARELAAHASSIAARLGATAWHDAARELDDRLATPAAESAVPTVHLQRHSEGWTIEWLGRSVTLPRLKGLGDLATLVQHPHDEIAALQLAGSTLTLRGTDDTVVDQEALSSYRQRLRDLETDIDAATADADLGRVERLEHEREQLVAELGRVTGLGGQPRTVGNDPAERARKAVSARIRDAISRLQEVAPDVGDHLDRSISTGLRCSYAPAAGDERSWRVTES